MRGDEVVGGDHRAHAGIEDGLPELAIRSDHAGVGRPREQLFHAGLREVRDLQVGQRRTRVELDLGPLHDQPAVTVKRH